ncbi:MAG: DUF3187 family protein [Pseudomonadota bacterium]
MAVIMRNTSDKEHLCATHRNHWQALRLICLLVVAGSAGADDFLAGERNRAPLSGLFLLNAVNVTADDSWRADWTTISHSARDQNADGAILFDGETSVLALTMNKRWSQRWSTSATLPYVWHSGGALDRFIDNWHNAFGLPDGIRNDRPRNALQFEFATPDDVVLARTQNTHGIGDMTLGARRSLGQPDSAWSLLLGLKLPLGDAARLTGSGAMDATIALGWTNTTDDQRWQFTANAGVALLGDADIKLQRQRSNTAFAQFSVVRRVSERLRLGARIYTHGAPLAAGPDAVSATAVGLAVGGQLALGDEVALNITVGEDLSVEVLPDVSFRIGLTMRH